MLAQIAATPKRIALRLQKTGSIASLNEFCKPNLVQPVWLRHFAEQKTIQPRCMHHFSEQNMMRQDWLNPFSERKLVQPHWLHHFSKQKIVQPDWLHGFREQKIMKQGFRRRFGGTCKPNPGRMYWNHGGHGGRGVLLRSLVATLAVLSCACVSTSPVRTYADLEAAVTRMRAEWYRSQLTEHPQGHLITSDLRYALFFRLPLAERVVVIMDSFANADLDGEDASTMGLMLYHRKKPSSRSLEMSSRYTDDRAYTAALFRAIESYPEEQVRRFCGDQIRYARFQRNLRRWKAYCELPSPA